MSFNLKIFAKDTCKSLCLDKSFAVLFSIFLISCAQESPVESPIIVPENSNLSEEVEIPEDPILEDPIVEEEIVAVEDVDGNAYYSIKIGELEWLSANLQTKKFKNGDNIPQIQDDEEWVKAGDAGKPAWCYYEDDAEKGAKYGIIYNYHAVTDPRGLAPDGWHVATTEEFEATDDFGSNMGIKMKSTTGWEKDGNGDNSTGFNGLAGGYRYNFGPYNQEGLTGYFWCIGEINDIMGPPYWNLTYNLDGLLGFACPAGSGLYVRCVKD